LYSENVPSPEDCAPATIHDQIDAVIEKHSSAGAIELIRSALVDYPNDPRLRARLGNCLWWTGHPDAENEIQEALRLNPHQGLALAGLAEIRVFQNDLTSALSLAEAAIEKGTASGDIFMKIAGVFQIAGDGDKARDAAEAALALAPHSPQILGSCAAIFSLIGDTAAHEEMAKRLDEEFPDHYRTYVVRARTSLRQFDVVSGENFARFAVAACPGSYIAWLTLAQALFGQGKLDEAEQMATNSLEINSRNPIAHQVLASISKGRRDTAAEKKHLLSAKQNSPPIKGVSEFGQASNLIKQNKKEEALQVLDAVEAEGNAISASKARDLALHLLVGLGQWQRLEQRLASFNNDKRKDYWHWAAAQLELHRGENKSAIDFLRKGVTVEAHGTLCRGALLKELYSNGRTEELSHEVKLTLEHECIWPLEAYSLVLGLIRIGRKTEAREVLDRWTRKFPYSRFLQRAYPVLLWAEGRRREAIQYARLNKIDFKIPVKASRGKRIRLRLKKLWEKVTGKSRQK